VIVIDHWWRLKLWWIAKDCLGTVNILFVDGATWSEYGILKYSHHILSHILSYILPFWPSF
jgi:prepilin-type processing-associated H-X9-DG protein